MIKSVQFKNFKVLRDAILPLSRFTLIVGPNGSGKSTALQALQLVAIPPSGPPTFDKVATAEFRTSKKTVVQVVLHCDFPHDGLSVNANWASISEVGRRSSKSSAETEFVVGYQKEGKLHLAEEEVRFLKEKLGRTRIYSFDARSIAFPVQLKPQAELSPDGGFLAGVLDNLRDRYPERFDALNHALTQWFPEFDRILFDTPTDGQRAFLLRMRKGHYQIPAADLSQGTLLALAILTLGYLQSPPSIICFEEPDHGVHPRLLRHIQEALYRLSYPENFGEKREPVQVIATTHSPYLLDLYKDQPGEIVIAHKTSEGARFERLSEQPHIMEILGDAPLGEVWYSGVLGGMPAEP